PARTDAECPERNRERTAQQHGQTQALPAALADRRPVDRHGSPFAPGRCLDQGLLRADTLRSVGTTNETGTSESGLRLNAWIAPQAVFPQAGLPIDGCALPTYCQRRTPAARRAG